MTRNQVAVALVLLATVNAFGFIDRVMIALVAEKIKAEFLVSDLQIGLLGGTIFAVVNAFASIPIARAAERFQRKYVTGLFLLLASIFTVTAGATSSFFQLVVCRLGMAAGNAATEAPPHSMISDMVPAEKRASAISIFMLGVPIAALLGSFLGGAVAERFGWRNTFLFFGILGVLISLLCLAWLREPPRQTSTANEGPAGGALNVAKKLVRDAKIRWLVLAVSSISLGSFGINTFMPAFFSRYHGLDAAQSGLGFGIVSGVASLVGTIAGGFGSERLARYDQRWLLGGPAIGYIVGVPIFIFSLSVSSLWVALPLMLLGSCTFYTAMGPSIATLHNSLDSFERATASALFLLVIHMVGQGFGPPLIGFVSDSASHLIYGNKFAAECAGAAAQVRGSVCAQASAHGLRYAMATFASFFVIGGGLLVLAARTNNSEIRGLKG
ncbi:MAG: MFS transporter [Sphingomonas sp.]|nr:MFS transporter [Sphingomonas sp.]